MTKVLKTRLKPKKVIKGNRTFSNALCGLTLNLNMTLRELQRPLAEVNITKRSLKRWAILSSCIIGALEVPLLPAHDAPVAVVGGIGLIQVKCF